MPALAGRMDCTGCGACSDACPAGALAMGMDREGFDAPRVDTSRCTECGLCARACPVANHAAAAAADGFPVPFAGWSVRPEIRRAGSSGGVFFELAAATVTEGGWVAGVRAEGLSVRHDLAGTLEDIRAFQGSKYLQSETRGIFRRAIEKLSRGEKVLFSGTPCQVAAMVGMASRRGVAANLRTCDVVCRGVPSRRFWQRYIEATCPWAREIGGFRDKDDGWKESFAVTLREAAGGRHCRRTYASGDSFLRAFAGPHILRNSCYDCRFAALPRHADVSLADYWGARSFPGQEREGISLVIVNSRAGMDLLESAGRVVLHRTRWAEALPANPRVYEGCSSLAWRRFPARRFLAAALQRLPFGALRAIYTDSIPRWKFWWWPYRLAGRRISARAWRRREHLFREVAGPWVASGGAP